MTAIELRFDTGAGGEVSALLERPAGARRLLVLGHGAGAGMRHRFLEALAGRLAERGIATFRYQFPYMEAGGGRPDRPPVLTAAVRAAVAAAAAAAPDLPLLAGGKSMGGRMTSTAAAEAPLPGVRGLVFFGFPLHAAGKPGSGRGAHLARVGFPLHAAGKPGSGRGAHLARVGVPMLFLQGTRDALADLDLLRPVLEPLGARATLHVVEGADHSFAVLKRSGRTGEGVLDELARTAAAWAEAL